MKLRFAPFALLTLLALASCAEKGGSSPIKGEESAVSAPPTAALLVETKVNMGCVVGQTLKDDLGKKLGEGVVLTAGKATEDAERRNDLYLIFDAKKQPGFVGMLAYRVWLEPKDPGAKNQATLNDIQVHWKENGWSLGFTAAGVGILRIEPMWTRSTELVSIWRTCPEADILEPFQARFLVAQPLETPLQPSGQFDLAAEPQKIEAAFERGAVSAIAVVDKCFEGLEALTKAFGSAESPYLWTETKLSRSAIADAIPGEVRGRGVIEVAVVPDRGAPVATTDPGFAPHLKLRIALLDKAGKRKGAEVRLMYLAGGPGGRGVR